ncbi:MAG TPA: heavy metal translocating P-type ATPase [Vicinamibacterales bacterium]|nr:heavy metal translocating P-type ATPase [Vicinamibacterales bacterium]
MSARKDHLGCSHCEVETPKPTGARVRGWLTAIAAVLAVAGCALGMLIAPAWWIEALLIAAAVVGSVFPAQRAWQSLKRRSLDINVLMVIAVVGAMFIGEYEEAAMVVTLFAAAQWLEAQSLDRARKAIGQLIGLAPSDVLVRDEAGERLINIDRVDPGTLMIVRPGEKFALDGIVRSGHSEVNQAPITGESLPVEKTEGDEVFAGTINGHGALTVAVTRRRHDTTLARIVNLVESAQAKRAPLQQFIDRFAAWYTPAIVALALLVAAVPLVVPGESADTWVYRALVLLVVSCPCALVISTPVSIVSALAGAARQGVLVKGGIHLERLAGVRVVAFDKTGTVTTGHLTLDAVRPLGTNSADDVVAAAASVESQSEHPIAAAILAGARTRQVSLSTPSSVRALPGLGVEGQIGNAQIVCGTPRLFASRGTLDIDAAAAAQELASRGMSPVIVWRSGETLGVLGVTDRPKSDAARVVSDLRAQGVSRVAMLTGDHDAAARATGSQVGVDDVRSAQLPEDKVTAVEELRHAHGAIAMVGDGVNDAPALAAADVGIVMGAMGSDAALETADIALMTDELPKVPYTIRLSRATLANIRINVALSIGLKLAFVVLAVAGVATLWMAVLADTGASALVVANAVRLRKFS